MHILIVRNNSNPQAIDASLLLAAYFSSQGISYTLLDSAELFAGLSRERSAEILACKPVLAVALGGDGTILRTARLFGYSDVPILGINFGHLGFLANPSDDGVVKIVAEALSGNAVLEKRANLQVDVVLEGERDPFDDGLFEFDGLAEDGELEGCNLWCAVDDKAGCDGQSRRSFFALNEMAITRGTMGRIIDLALDISGAHISDVRGDGMVVASATGSTAYALSAGGPLVAPSYMGLVVVPLAPHSIRSRAVLTGENDVVMVDLADNYATREATLFLDGELVPFDKPIRRIYIRRGSATTSLLRYSNRSFYEHAAATFF
ncbi:MAG: NAD(+)/NADH kinase [Eggerthellaceae bacterium]|nr:NAD(+)/NADH kinase [Eggerthellaceae bacterium]